MALDYAVKNINEYEIIKAFEINHIQFDIFRIISICD